MKKNPQFNNPQEMLDYLQAGNDLYCPSEGIYVFEYNEAGSICYYYLNAEEVAQLRRDSEETGEYWGAFLGTGGYICDTPEYYFEQGSSKNPTDLNEDILNGNTAIQWCAEFYMNSDWEDVTPEKGSYSGH